VIEAVCVTAFRRDPATWGDQRKEEEEERRRRGGGGGEKSAKADP
jgi:hypothetical protein